jgi:hypothetical protein
VTYIEEPKNVIRSFRGVEFTRRERLPKREAFQGKAIWERTVEVFELHDDSNMNTAYA